MSTAGVALVLASYRGGSTYAPLYETFVILPLIAVMLAACVLIGVHLRRSNRRIKPVANQWQALAVMGELCPHGWQAQITLGEQTLPAGDDSQLPSVSASQVRLEWTQFDEQNGHVLVTRRLSAPSIGAALQAMVEDRQTDMTLEEIERSADGDGSGSWPAN